MCLGRGVNNQRKLLVQVCFASKYTLSNTSFAHYCATVYSHSVNLRIYCAASVSNLYNWKCHKWCYFISRVPRFSHVSATSAISKCHMFHNLIVSHVSVPRVEHFNFAISFQECHSVTFKSVVISFWKCRSAPCFSATYNKFRDCHSATITL